MKRDAIKIKPEYFQRYIELVPNIELMDALKEFGEDLLQRESPNLFALHLKTYAPDKWNVHDILQHIIDTERILCYRALCFSRKDGTSLPSFDENNYANEANASNRPFGDLLEEFYAVRKSTIFLFESFSISQLCNEGTASDKKISVLALGFTIVGHALHHMSVLKERYYPLLAIA